MLLNSYVNLGSAHCRGSGSLSYTDAWDHDFFSAPSSSSLFLISSFSSFYLHTSLSCSFFSFPLIFIFILFTPPSPLGNLPVPVGKENEAKLIFFHSADENPEDGCRDMRRYRRKECCCYGSLLCFLSSARVYPWRALQDPRDSRQERALKLLSEIENR